MISEYSLEAALVDAKYIKSVTEQYALDNETAEVIERCHLGILSSAGQELDDTEPHVSGNTLLVSGEKEDVMLTEKYRVKHMTSITSSMENFIRPYKKLFSEMKFSGAEKICPSFEKNYGMFFHSKFSPKPRMLFLMTALFYCQEISVEAAFKAVQEIYDGLDSLALDFLKATFLTNLRDVCGGYAYFIEQNPEFILSLQEKVRDFGEDKLQKTLEEYPQYTLYR